jgi:hypothetical protein
MSKVIDAKIKPDKHKIMTELRIRCIQKEYLLDFYSNPENFLQTKIISVSSSVSS